jgi:hypothetical protein
MISERAQGMTAMLRILADDCATDTAARDGQPLTGANVAKWLGEMSAQIAAIADVLIAILGNEDEV